MYYRIIAVVLYLFWLLLSGHYKLMLLSLGALSALLVAWFVRRMDNADGEPSFVYPTGGLLRYGGWLLWSLIKANVDVARRIWDPDMPIDPRWRRLDTQVTSNLQKTLYANSITLTPGTLTTDVKEDHFIVHGLSEAGIADLRQGEMERQIQRSGI